MGSSFMNKNFVPKREDLYNMQRNQGSLLSKNQGLSYAIIISCMLFLFVFFLEKSKSFVNLIPTLRGEVKMSDGVVITTIQNRYPILIRQDDPYIGTQLRYSGDINSLFSQAAVAICSRDEKIIEVGANFGFNTILLGKSLSDSGKIYAYEPNQTAFSCLQKSIYLNDLTHIVEFENIALSDHTGECDIEDITTVTKNENGELCKGEIRSVKCSTLDEIFEGKDASLLLIDIPGQEFHIVNHAHKVIEASRNLKILVSFKNSGVHRGEQTFEYLHGLGYKCYVVSVGPNFTEITKEELMQKSEGILLFSKTKV